MSRRQSRGGKPPQPAKVARASLRVDARTNFVYAGPVKIGRYIPERRTIQVKDKCRGRRDRTGTEFVEVSVDEFPTLETKRCQAKAGVAGA